MKKNNPQLNKGFTLVETLVAISIFTIALIGMLNITGGSIGDTNYARDKMVATYLASEGVEYIRNLRDTYTLFEANGWDNFLVKIEPCNEGNKTVCKIDPNPINFTNQIQPMKDLDITTCAGGICPTFYFDSTVSNKYRYNYQSGIATSFRRKVSFRNVVNESLNREIEVISTVSWTTGRRQGEVVSSTYLKSWNEF